VSFVLSTEKTDDDALRALNRAQSARHARGAARWGGVAVFGLFWLIGDESFAWAKSVVVGGASEEEE
jgi:hypothetical protein